MLVATGLYGTLAFRVSRRTAEIGVRMAMGAGRGQVVWMILRDSLLLVAFGVVAGVPLANSVGRALSSSLYGVKPLDPLNLCARRCRCHAGGTGGQRSPGRQGCERRSDEGATHGVAIT